MTINWLRPFWRLQNEDFKEIIHMALYDLNKKGQRLYFHDTDKSYLECNTFEYVFMCLPQQYEGVKGKNKTRVARIFLFLTFF